MSRNEATRETTSFIHYKHMATVAAGVTAEAADSMISRIAAAYDIGEPVWMIADEMRLRAAAPRRMKSPRALAAAVYRAA